MKSVQSNITAATGVRPAVYVAIELSKKSWLIALRGPAVDRISLHRLAAALSEWFVRRVGELRGRLRRIMVVALARKLLVALWRYLETGLVPQGATLRA